MYHPAAITISPPILADNPKAKILVIGAGDRKYPRDAAHRRTTGIDCICDLYDIPYPDQPFDAVIADSVLEHVCDPQRRAEQQEREAGRLLHAVTPFLPGHQALTISRASPIWGTGGCSASSTKSPWTQRDPAYAAIHLFREQLLCLTDGHHPPLLRLAGCCLPIRCYLDPFFRAPGATYNSGCALLGRKRETPIPDREIIKLFRGR